MSDSNRSTVSRVNSSDGQIDGQTAAVAAAAEVDNPALPDVPLRYQMAQRTGSQAAQIHADLLSPVDISVNPPTQTNLTGPQLAAIELIVLGKTDSFVAFQVQVHIKTVTRWRLYHAAFRAELARRRQEVWGSAGDRFRAMLGKALDIYSAGVSSTDQRIAHRTATALLALASKFAPPDEPVEPLEVLAYHARRLKRMHNSCDPMLETVDEDELKMAADDLTLKLNGSELPLEKPLPDEKAA